MARVNFSSDLNIKPARQTFPKLTKLKKGEKVRIQLVDPTNIEMQFVHDLRVPVLENGEGVRDSEGKWETRFIGNPLSLGDPSIIEDKGLDVKNCPISAFSKEHPDWVTPPRRKFALNVVQYKTRPNSFKLAEPFAVEHKVWVFTDKTFLKLQEFTEEWGDLRKHDLYITCENERFQQYDIQVAPEAAWVTEKQVEYVMGIYNAGAEEYADLDLAIGAKKEKRWIEADLKEIEEAWGVVLGTSSTSGFSSPDAMVEFLDAPKESAPKSDATEEALAALSGEPAAGKATDFDDLLASLGQ